MKYVIAIVCLVVLSSLVTDFNNRMTEYNRLSADKEIVKHELQSKLDKIITLETQIAYAKSDAAVHEWAIQNHMIRDGEVPVVPIGEGEPTATPQPTPTPLKTPEYKINHWLLLFFDTQAP